MREEIGLTKSRKNIPYLFMGSKKKSGRKIEHDENARVQTDILQLSKFQGLFFKWLSFLVLFGGGGGKGVLNNS